MSKSDISNKIRLKVARATTPIVRISRPKDSRVGTENAPRSHERATAIQLYLPTAGLPASAVYVSYEVTLTRRNDAGEVKGEPRVDTYEANRELHAPNPYPAGSTSRFQYQQATVKLGQSGEPAEPSESELAYGLKLIEDDMKVEILEIAWHDKDLGFVCYKPGQGTEPASHTVNGVEVNASRLSTIARGSEGGRSSIAG